MFFGIALAAISAAETLQAVPMLAKAAAFNLARGADHRSSFGLAHHELSIQQGLAVKKMKVRAQVPGVPKTRYRQNVLEFRHVFAYDQVWTA